MIFKSDVISDLTTEPLVIRYFEGFNQGQFDTVAALFAPAGCLHAPFEAPIVGREAIAAYLSKEAVDMEAYPETVAIEQLSDGCRQVVVKGRVKAIVFQVNVAWTFRITPTDQIEAVEVKLLASLQDLVRFRPQPSS